MSNKIEGGVVFHDCHGCGEEFREDDVSWATPDGELTTMRGDPYCDACLPEEKLTCENTKFHPEWKHDKVKPRPFRYGWNGHERPYEESVDLCDDCFEEMPS